MPDAAVVPIRFVVNGETLAVDVHPMSRLLDILRHELHLTGTKEGCGEGECGACSVLINGQLVNSCLTPVLQADGAAITTIEGVAHRERAHASEPDGAEGGAGGPASDAQLHAIQAAFLEHGGAQCGICTPGMVLASMSLLDRHPNPTEEQVRVGLAGNLCRCTGYMRIFEAVVRAGEGTRQKAEGTRQNTEGKRQKA